MSSGKWRAFCLGRNVLSCMIEPCFVFKTYWCMVTNSLSSHEWCVGELVSIVSGIGNATHYASHYLNQNADLLSINRLSRSVTWRYWISQSSIISNSLRISLCYIYLSGRSNCEWWTWRMAQKAIKPRIMTWFFFIIFINLSLVASCIKAHPFETSFSPTLRSQLTTGLCRTVDKTNYWTKHNLRFCKWWWRYLTPCCVTFPINKP